MNKPTLFDAIIAIRRQKEKDKERQMRLRRQFTRKSGNRQSQEPILPPVMTIY